MHIQLDQIKLEKAQKDAEAKKKLMAAKAERAAKKAEEARIAKLSKEE